MTGPICYDPTIPFEDFPRTKAEARLAGSKVFFSGKPCPKGHIVLRYTNGGCRKCVNDLASLNHFQKKNKYDFTFRTKKLVSYARKRARDKGLPFNLEYEKMTWPTHCPVFGYEIDYFVRDKTAYNSPSIDRVDNTKGYTHDNVCVISHRANALKNGCTVSDLKTLISYIENFKPSE